MSIDKAKLKALAEAANAVTGAANVEITICSEAGPNQAEIDAVTAFVGVSTSAIVLALLAEIERLEMDNRSLKGSCSKLGAEHAGMNRLYKKANRMQFDARQERDQLKAEVEELKQNVFYSDQIIETRSRLLKSIPPCPVHGDQCVPHAQEWVEAARKDVERYQWLRHGMGKVVVVEPDNAASCDCDQYEVLLESEVDAAVDADIAEESIHD